MASFIQNQFEQNIVTTSVDHVFNWARLSSIWPLTFGPVSYTHLDVYKRQG